ncbi:MAG: type IV pilus modification PilV family protein [Chitinivibrionales bacterium]
MSKQFAREGFSIVELMVSMVIVAFVVITVMRVFKYSAESINAFRTDYSASILAENEAERIKFMMLSERMPDDTVYTESIDEREYEIIREVSESDTLEGFSNAEIMVKEIDSDSAVFTGLYMIPDNGDRGFSW